MSHRITCKTAMKEKKYLIAGLKLMGLNPIDCGSYIDLDQVSFRQVGDVWQLEGDPYYSDKLRKYYRLERELVREVQKNYLLAQVRDRVENELGYGWEEEEVEETEEGLVKLTVGCQWN